MWTVADTRPSGSTAGNSLPIGGGSRPWLRLIPKFGVVVFPMKTGSGTTPMCVFATVTPGRVCHPEPDPDLGLSLSSAGERRTQGVPKSWVQYEPYEPPVANPTPSSVREQLRMLALWPALPIQLAMTSAGVACPAAMFSAIAVYV